MSLSPGIWAGDVVVLVGHPVAGSRTSSVAAVVGAGLVDGRGGPAVVQLADLGPRLLEPDDRVRTAQDAVRGARVLVVATPVYKAGYSGVLKVFLDGLEATALESTIAVPVVLSASPAHGALADLQLRTVLQAMGALLPVPSFVLEEHHLDDLPEYVDAWRQRFGGALAGTAEALRFEEADT
jgi:FMN reductase